MAKTMEIDLSDDRLIAIASDLVDSHNYIEALKMLNKNAEISGDDDDSLMLYAEIFDDIGLYEKSINGWFKYLDNTNTIDLAECYEGLAMGFMNIGDEHFSAYYYNKLLMETDEMDPAAREDIIREFLSAHSDNPLKFVYPPNLADFTDEIRRGVDFMKEGDFESAIAEFEKVADGNPKYLSARNYVAMCKIIADRTDEAAEECYNILKNHPDDVQALTTLAAVRTEQKNGEAAAALAKKLLKLGVSEPDDIYKIATVCCENKMHLEAYETFCKLPSEFDYDLTVLYFKAVSAFNCGKTEESLAIFDKLTTVYPTAVTARYYYNIVRKLAETGEKQELSYFYRLPPELRENSLKVLMAYARLPQASAKKLAEAMDLTSCVRWCFDEPEGKDLELQRLACHVAVKAGLDEILREVLLNAFLGDSLKIETLGLIAERNVFDYFGVVICNVFKGVTVQALDIGKSKKKLFVRAYAKLFAHFAILKDEYSDRFADGAESLYRKLEAEGRLDGVRNVDALCAAIYVVSGVNAVELGNGGIYQFLGVTEQQVNKILGE